MEFDLDRAVAAYPASHRSYRPAQGDGGEGGGNAQCFFGTRPDSLFGTMPLSTIPRDATKFLFFGGAVDTDVLEALLRSPFRDAITSIGIGTSTDRDDASMDSSMDYRHLVALLARARLPRLTWLSLGDDELLANQSKAFGTVGDVTALLGKSPSLESLTLCGRFDLSAPVELPALRDLDVHVDDGILMNGGPLSAETVAHLLASPMPSLQTLTLDLTFDGQHSFDEPPSPEYALPASLLDGTATPLLSRMWVAGRFIPASREALAASLLGRRLGPRLDAEGVE